MPTLTPPAVAKSVAEFAGHSSTVAAVAFTPDRALLISADRDGTARVWDLGGARPGPRGDVPRTGEPVRALACAPNSRVLAVASDTPAGLVRLFDITDKTPTPSATLRGARGAVAAVAFSADGKLIAGGGDDGTLRLWELGPTFRGDARAMLTGHTKPITSAAVAPDGQTVATGSQDGTARTWTTSRIRPSPRATLPHPAAVTTVAYLPDGKSLVTACADGRVRVWDLSALKPTVRLEFAAAVRVLAVSADVLTGTTEGAVVTNWDARTGAVLAAWEVPGAGTVAALTGDGRYLARGTAAGGVGVFRVAEKRVR